MNPLEALKDAAASLDSTIQDVAAEFEDVVSILGGLGDFNDSANFLSEITQDDRLTMVSQLIALNPLCQYIICNLKLNAFVCPSSETECNHSY